MEYVENAFKNFKLDHVQIEESHYVVTYPDSKSKLEVLGADEKAWRNVTINRNVEILNHNKDVGEGGLGGYFTPGRAEV